MRSRRLAHWTRDYLYAIHKATNAFIFRKPPAHYLGYTNDTKSPIILIPGIFEKWHFLKAIADPLSLKGHPIYALEHLHYNTKEIPVSASLVRELIEEKGLKKAIIVAHSKGGLIGKHLLAFYNKDDRVKKLIAIATPFGGSEIVKFIPHKRVRELSPESKIIQELQQEKAVNKKIISIYGVFDNHIWPETSCCLEGAENIQLEAYGHHKILSDKKVIDLIISKVESD